MGLKIHRTLFVFELQDMVPLHEESMHCSKCIKNHGHNSEERVEIIFMLLHFGKTNLHEAAYSHILFKASKFVQSPLETPLTEQGAYLHSQVCKLDV